MRSGHTNRNAWDPLDTGVWFNRKLGLARFEVILAGGPSRGSRRRRKKVPATTPAEALEKAAVFRKEILEPEGVPRPAHPTFGWYIERYFAGRRDTVASATWTSYEWIVKTKLLPRFAGRRLDEITMPEIREFFGWLKKTERPDGTRLSAPTINRIVACLRMLLRDGYDRGLVQAMPYRGRLPHEKEPQLQLELSEEERDRFLGSFDDEDSFRAELKRTRKVGRLTASSRFRSERRFGGGLLSDGDAATYYLARFRRYKPLFVVALETGLRRSDLLGLTWSNVDLKEGRIRLTTKKTKASVVIPMTHDCREALEECRRRPVVAEHVFAGEDGRPVSWTTVRRYFALAKSLAGITRRLRFHDLRHSYASRLASAGVSLSKIAKKLGHSTVRLSERYARPSDDDDAEIIAALEAASNKTPSKLTGMESGRA